MSIDSLPIASAAQYRLPHLSAVLARCFGAVGEAQRSALAYERLSRLSDVELADRGLSRDDLPRAVLAGAR